eukprot:2914047-Prymnesium_polylepis.2
MAFRLVRSFAAKHPVGLSYVAYLVRSYACAPVLARGNGGSGGNGDSSGGVVGGGFALFGGCSCDSRKGQRKSRILLDVG